LPEEVKVGRVEEPQAHELAQALLRRRASALAKKKEKGGK